MKDQINFWFLKKKKIKFERSDQFLVLKKIIRSERSYQFLLVFKEIFDIHLQNLKFKKENHNNQSSKNMLKNNSSRTW